MTLRRGREVLAEVQQKLADGPTSKAALPEIERRLN